MNVDKPGDEETPPGVVGSDSKVDAGPDDAEQEQREEEDQGNSAREQLINEVAARVAAQVLTQIGSQTKPPTEEIQQSENVYQAEAMRLKHDMDALERQIEHEGGYTSKTLVKRLDLTDRASNLRANLVIHAMQQSETQRAVKDIGKEDRWLKYYADNKHRGDLEILRAAFERDEIKAGRLKPAVAKPSLERKHEQDDDGPDISPPAELGARQVAARSMSMEQIRSHKSRLESEGKYDQVRKFDASLRNGEVIVVKK